MTADQVSKTASLSLNRSPYSKGAEKLAAALEKPVADKPYTIIDSNGSKWLGDEPDSIDQLVKVLGETPLNRMFERYGNFASRRCPMTGEVRFFGNFFGLSHVFSIVSNDPAVIGRLRKAINANKKRPDYLSQHLEPARAALTLATGGAK